MSKNQIIELGDRVKDPITGFAGIVTGMTTWLHGCIRVGVAPEKMKDGKIGDEVWFDQARVEVVKKNVHEPIIAVAAPAPAAPKHRSTGGPARESAKMRGR